MHIGIDSDLLADRHPADPFADRRDRTDQFMTGCQREPRIESAPVQVQIRAADPHLYHLDQHLAGRRLRRRHLGDAETLRGVIQHGLHRWISFGPMDLLGSRASTRSVDGTDLRAVDDPGPAGAATRMSRTSRGTSVHSAQHSPMRRSGYPRMGMVHHRVLQYR